MTAEPVVVIGAGPAGLTAAIELLRLGRDSDRSTAVTCLGLEYFVIEGDELWQSPDAALIELATAELVSRDDDVGPVVGFG